MAETKNNDEQFPEVKPTKPGNDTAYIAPIIGKLGYDTRRPWLFGLGTSPNNGVDFHVFLSFDGLNFDDNDIDKIWNGGTADKVKREVDSATAEIPAAVSAANSAVSAAESAVAASKVNSDAIAAQSEAISEAKAAMDSATAEIQQTAANAASDAAKIRADVAKVQNEVDTAKAANSASVEALKSDVSAAKQDLSDVHDSLDKAQSAIEQNQKLINDSVAKITSDVSATKQDLADVHDSLTKAQAAAEQNQKAINDSIAQINANVDATNQDLAGVRKDLAKAQSDITANQKAVNDNVAQINSNIEQDRKDIASAQQANADTAKQLDTYSKQAQEQGKTIKSIQDKQDGFTATIANVQGNVTQVSDKVDGLSASLKDAQDNVASVKAQADQLSATLTDHAKSIATLTASAKELSSTLEDADGRLSKVEQTAQTNSSTLSDVQGDLSQVKQNATKLVSTLKDAQGNISTLQQKADSVSAQLASAQGDIATLQTGVDGVKATLTSHDKSIHTLQADSKSLKDSMTNAQGDISTLQKSATSLDSEMKDHAGRISKVEQSAATQATTLSDLQGNLTQVKQQADGLVTTLKDAQGDITQIQQKADGTLEQLKSAQGDIASLQTDVTGIKATLTSHEGDIHTLQADSKTLKDDMQDAQGNISSLQKSSTKLDSEFSSQDGRLSKVEQTANEHTSTISDLGDKLNNMKVGGRNLAVSTSHKWQNKSGFNGGTNVIVNVADYIDLSDVKVGDTLQVGITIKKTSGDDSGNASWFVQGQKNGDGWSWIRLGSTFYNKNYTNDQSYKVASFVTVTDSIKKGQKLKPVQIRFDNVPAGTIFSWKDFYVKIGATPTDWTPAPEDLATVTQVKQTTDGIETTLKNAQGDIDQIKQTAKGTSEQLSNVQGDVTNIQKDVDGLKQTTADNAGNIHTLQSDSKSLHDSMQDAQGDISTLKKTSTDVVSELKDHAGRISKTEQTASTLVNELADQQGHLNRVEQKATGTEQTVANQQGQINNIKTDVSGVHETITGQGNQIATINTSLNGLNTKYEGVSGDLGKLSDKVTTNSTQITQNKKEIDLKADQSTVDNLTGEVSQNKAQLKIQTGQINQKVSSTEYQTLKDKVNGMKIGGRNLLHGTSDKWVKFTNGGWGCFTTANFSEVSTSEYHTGDTFTYSATICNNGKHDVALQLCPLDSNKKPLSYYSSASVKPGQQNMRVSCTASVDANTYYMGVWVYFPNDDGSNDIVLVKEEQLEEGNVRTPWTPNPDDTIASIQKNTTDIDENSKQISLKADQTEVDQVKQTATQNSSRLNVMADEISSKVTSTDVNNIVNSKGYATTSTVQSLITQKAGTINESITNLDAKYSAKDGVNLQTGTSDCSFPFTANQGQAVVEKYDDHTKMIHAYGSASGFYIGFGNGTFIPDIGEKYTISADIKGKGTIDRNGFKYEGSDSISTNEVTLSNNWQRISCTVHVSQHAGTWIFYPNPGNGNNDFYVKHIKIEHGSVATPWTPAPIDNATVTQVQEITASIDGLQSTVANKADKSQITQLSNMIQSKVSASDFTSKITQLSTDINARVTKGDLLSQINLQAGKTLIQSGKIYLDANTIVFGKNSKAIIPSAAIGNLDAAKITTGSISVPMSDGKDNSISFEEDGVVIKSKGKSSDFYDANEGTSKLKITGAGVEFISSTDNDESIKRLGIMTPTTYQNVNTSGMTFVVTGVGDSSSGTLNDRGAFFSLARKTLSYPLDYKGMIYATGEMGDLDTGFHFNDPVYIHPYGAETGIRSTWCSWSSMGNRKFPVLVNSDHGWSGIAFPMQGQAFVFSNNGYVARPNQKIDSYNGYGEGNRDYFDSTDPNQKH